MKNTGIFYGSSSGKTASVAMRIFKKLGRENNGVFDVAETSLARMNGYENLILGIPTWGIGELQDDWLAVLPELEYMDLSGKTVALFGLGDQESYPDTFTDAMGKLHEVIRRTGCRITGSWPVEGYDFDESGAVRGKEFVGLALDEENQQELTVPRIDRWLGKLDLS